MIYQIKRFIWRIKNIIKWIPILWNQFDWDYNYALEVFKFQLKKTSEYLNSDDARTLSAKFYSGRINTIIKLMNKVYEDDYSMEYLDKVKALYPELSFKTKFIETEKGNFSIKYEFELSESEEVIDKVNASLDLHRKLSYEKQEKAHRILWKLIERNIRNLWD
jgi:hypothetical protein